MVVRPNVDQASTNWLRYLLSAARPDWNPKNLTAAEDKLRRVGADSVSELGRLLTKGLNKLLRQHGEKTFSDETVDALRVTFVRKFPLPDPVPALTDAAPAPALTDAAAEPATSAADDDGLGPAAPEALRRNRAGDGAPSEPPAAEAAPERPSGEGAAAVAAGGHAPGEAEGPPPLCDVLRAARPSWTPKEIDAIEKRLARVGVHNVSQLGAHLLNGLNRLLLKSGLKTFNQNSINALEARFSEPDIQMYLKPARRRKQSARESSETKHDLQKAAKATEAVDKLASEAAAGDVDSLHASRVFSAIAESIKEPGRRRKKDPRWMKQAKERQPLSTSVRADADEQWRLDVDFKRLLDRASRNAGFCADPKEGMAAPVDLERESRAAEADHQRRQEQLVASGEGARERREMKREQQVARAGAVLRALLQEEQREAEAERSRQQEGGEQAPGSEEPAAPEVEVEQLAERSRDVELAEAESDAAKLGEITDGNTGLTIPEAESDAAKLEEITDGNTSLTTPEAKSDAAKLKEATGPIASEAEHWTVFEQRLHNDSKGLFNPGTDAKTRRGPKHGSVRSRVSVVVPTIEERQQYHEQLWEIFNAQTWMDKELVVVETYAKTPSLFFSMKQSEDDRIVYWARQVPACADIPIGVKRNICTYLASGFHVANFDDDDLYAPCYLATMIEAMREHNSNAITLASWYVFDAQAHTFGHLDPFHARGKGWISPEKAEEWVLGYGFSYVYTREIALALPYPPLNYQEDTAFFMAVRARNCPGRLARWCRDEAGTVLLDDAFGICLHTLHHFSTSSSVSDARCYNELSPEELGGLEINDLGSILRRHQTRLPRQSRSSRFIKGGQRRRMRTLQIDSSEQTLEVCVPVGATCAEVRLELEKVAGAGPIELCRRYRRNGEEEPQRFPLPDSEIIGMQTEGLWAVLPKDRPIVVTVADIPDYAVQVQVHLPHCFVNVATLRLAMLEQHGTDTASSRKAGCNVRLARMTPAGKFFPVDTSLEVGEARVFFATWLAELLGRTRGKGYPSEELAGLRWKMYGSSTDVRVSLPE